MNQEFWVRTVSKNAWKDFGAHYGAWITLATGAAILTLISVVLPFYVAQYKLGIAVAIGLVGAIYTAILHQNGLDAAYNRPLSMFKISSSILFASLFFIALSLYQPLPNYIHLLAIFIPSNFKFFLILNWILHIIISYLLMRCMFVGMIILEDKCNIKQAFEKSWRMTSHHLIMLFCVFLYLAFALALSMMTIIGYFAILPYTMIMKSLLYKEINSYKI